MTLNFFNKKKKKMKAWFYEMSRRLVVRMDLLPHVEMIHFLKIGAFGTVISKLARIDDLEKVNYEELSEKGKVQ